MKKLALTVGIILLVMVFFACGGSPSISGEEAQAETQTETEEAVKINEVDNDDIYFVINGTLEEAFGGVVGFTAYMENRTDKNLMFSWTDSSVNGYMVENWFAEEVAPGKKANADIYFMSSDMEDNNITSVEEAEYTLRVYNNDDWSEDPIFEKQFSITVK